MTLAKARELAVLALLRVHPSHGYDLSRALGNGPFALLGLSRAATYAVLNRLSRRGLIEGETRSSGNHPDKTVMHLTEAGETELLVLAGGATVGGDGSVVPLMALFLAKDAGLSPSREALSTILDARRATLAELRNDHEHQGSRSARLAARILTAEIESLAELLDEEPDDGLRR